MTSSVSANGGAGEIEPEDEHVPLRGLRRQIAKKMSESWRSVPHITDWREADATQLIDARRVMRSHLPDISGALSFVPLFVKITAIALRSHPLLNASFDEANEEYVLHRRINIGIATAARDGLLVPVVPDADRKTIVELAEEIAELVALARERKATSVRSAGRWERRSSGRPRSGSSASGASLTAWWPWTVPPSCDPQSCSRRSGIIACMTGTRWGRSHPRWWS
jgi:pyruvate dehydrogenase E2 component (dihydrolipoamide acetyltransferase)